MEASRHTVGGLRSFSVAKMHAAKGNTFPWLSCKASDSIVLLKWLRFHMTVILTRDLTEEAFKLSRWLHDAAEGGLAFSQGFHGHGLYFPSSCCLHLRSSIFQFQRAYFKLAQHCVIKRITLFGVTPKMHALSHFRRDLDIALRSGRRLVFNPGAFDVSASEDFIGRISRQSRRISFKRTSFQLRLLQVYLLKTRYVLSAWRKKQHQGRALVWGLPFFGVGFCFRTQISVWGSRSGQAHDDSLCLASRRRKLEFGGGSLSSSGSRWRFFLLFMNSCTPHPSWMSPTVYP